MAKQPQNPLSVTRLCMDARMLVGTGGTGVSSYARQLQMAHQAISADHSLLTDRIDPALPPAALGRLGRWLRALLPGPRQASLLETGAVYVPDLFRVAQVYFDVHRRPLPVQIPGPAGIMHWTYPVPLTVRGWRNVYTVHDVIPLRHPTLTHIDGRRYRRLLCRLADSAACFVTVSQIARAEIVEATRCPDSFVVDCSLAVDATAPDAQALPPALAAGRYLLICGTVEKRKNVAAALAAYRMSGVTMPLVIAGPDGWGAEGIAAQISATPGAIRLPYLDRAAVRALIGHTRALVMPSLAEGFGLPVAEAMALGVPVVTADRGALAETAGGAAIAIDPQDIAAIATALQRIAGDDALHAERSAAGRRNAERFTPARFAQRLTAAYAAVMADPA